MKENKTHHEASWRFGFWFFTTGAILLLLAPSAHASPDQCLAYAYTSSGNHFFLIQDNSSNFGSNVSIVSNCDNVTIEIDGEFYAQISKNTQIPINPGLHNFSLISENFTANYSNVLFYPDYLEWELNYQLTYLDDEVNFIDAAILEARTNWAVFFGIVIVWILCVYVYWNLINTFVQRNFIEEVVQ